MGRKKSGKIFFFYCLARRGARGALSCFLFSRHLSINSISRCPQALLQALARVITALSFPFVLIEREREAAVICFFSFFVSFSRLLTEGEKTPPLSFFC